MKHPNDSAVWVFFVPAKSQPRYAKRIAIAGLAGDVVIGFFSRGVYERNELPTEGVIELVDFGIVKNKRYVERGFQVVKAVRLMRNIIRKHAGKALYFYAFGLDCLLIARLSGLSRGVYEVGDIQFPRQLTNLYALLERVVLPEKSTLVVTSPYFLIELSKTLSSWVTSAVVIENKVPSLVLDRVVSSPRVSKVVAYRRLRIGVIGFLRYEQPLKEILAFAAENLTFCELLCWGDGPYADLFRLANLENVRFFGDFKNPDDLATIYSQVDINYVVYGDFSVTDGVRTALPNKLYESVAFEVPLICRSGTALSAVIDEWGVGAGIELQQVSRLNEYISQSQLAVWRENCRRVSRSRLLDNGGETLKHLMQFIEQS
jgi:succinoglycan biosynthesis protein ExoL